MTEFSQLSGEWVVGLGLFALLLALLWQVWFPGLSDSAPESEYPAAAPRVDTAAPGQHRDLPA